MQNNLDDKALKHLAGRVLDIEARAVSALSERLDDRFVEACRLCAAVEGRVVVTGMRRDTPSSVAFSKINALRCLRTGAKQSQISGAA